MARKLTVKQKKFADEYIITGNATESAIKAGYSKKTAAEIGYENLNKLHIKSYIDERLQKLEDKQILRQEEVLKLLTKQARREEVDHQVVISEKIIKNEKGKTIGILKSSEVVEIPTQNKDAIKALELIGKRYGIWTDKTEHTIELPIFIDDLGDDIG